MKKALWAIILISNAAFCAGLGIYGAGNERIPLTSKAWALGNAVTAKPEYANLWYNPARLAFSDGLQLSLGNAIRLLGRNESFLLGEYKIPKKRVGLGSTFSYKGISNLDGLRFNGETMGSASYVSTTTKVGVGVIVTNSWALGVSGSWYYSRLPVRFNEDNRSVETSTSSTVGGLSFMASYVKGYLSLGFGIKDIFAYNDWSYAEAPNLGMITTVIDTLPAVGAFGANYVLIYGGAKEIRMSSDINVYAFNSFFRRYDGGDGRQNTAAATCFGLEWQPNEITVFRTGIRDILINRNLFRNTEAWKTENNPRLGFGIGLNLESIVNTDTAKKFAINYALANSGAQIGLEHIVDIVWKF